MRRTASSFLILLGLLLSACGGQGEADTGPDAASAPDAAGGADVWADAPAQADAPAPGQGDSATRPDARVDAGTGPDARADAADASDARPDSAGGADAGCVADCAGKACGASDGCGGACVTGSCEQGQRCVSGSCQCDATSCNGCCSGSSCEPGTAQDACGQGGAACRVCAAGDVCGTGACGTCGGKGQPCCAGSACSAPLTCGGGGVSNVCGCTASCAGKACGASDGCGGICASGSCASGQRCVNAACECDTTSCTGCCAGNLCQPGTADAACGKGGAACATCSAPLSCGGGGQASLCGCTPQCTGKACGASDGCGGTCTGGWTVETVSTGPGLLENASMVIDGSGNLQIVYWQSTASGGSGDLVHAYKANGVWSKTTIVSDVLGVQSGLAVDGTGNLHLVFLGTHYVFANGSWSAVDSYCAPGDSCDNLGAAIAVAPDGSLHVAYYPNDLTSVVRYAVHTASGWSFETVDPNGPTYAVYDDGIAIGFLPGGVPAVGYQGPTSVNFASRAGGTWTIEKVQTSPGDYSNISMEIDPASGDARMIYDVGYGVAGYAQRSNGVWATTPMSGWGVLPSGAFPTPARIAFDGFTNVNSPSPVELLTQRSDGSFGTETIVASPGNGFAEQSIIQGSGAGGTISVLLGGYQQMLLYRRCASP